MNKIVSSMMNKLNKKLIIDKKAYSFESDVAEENDTSTDHDKENVLSNPSDNNLVLDKTMGINYGKESNTNHAKLVEIERNNLLNSINNIKENLNKKGNGKVKKGKKFKVFETLNNNNYVPPIIDINFNNNLNFNNFTTNKENEFINKKKVMNNSNNKEKKKNDFSEILERKLWNGSKEKKKKKTEVFVCKSWEIRKKDTNVHPLIALKTKWILAKAKSVNYILDNEIRNWNLSLLNGISKCKINTLSVAWMRIETNNLNEETTLKDEILATKMTELKISNKSKNTTKNYKAPIIKLNSILESQYIKEKIFGSKIGAEKLNEKIIHKKKVIKWFESLERSLNNIIWNNKNQKIFWDSLKTYSKAKDIFGLSILDFLEKPHGDVKEFLGKLKNKLNNIDHYFFITRIFHLSKIQDNRKKSIEEIRNISILPAWFSILERMQKFIIERKISILKLKNQMNFIHKNTFAYQKNKTTTQAKTFLTREIFNNNICCKIDLEKFFPSINLNNNKIKKLMSNLKLDHLNDFMNMEVTFFGDNFFGSSNGIGVPQGGVLSPLIASLIISDILYNLPDLEIITYSDDWLFSARSLYELENKLQIIKKTISLWGLNIRPDKIQILASKNVKLEEKNSITFNFQEIKILDKIKYLGQYFDAEGPIFDKELLKRKTNIAYTIVKNLNMSSKRKLIVWNLKVRSCINHLLPCLLIKENEEFLKKIYQLIVESACLITELKNEENMIVKMGITPIQILLPMNSQDIRSLFSINDKNAKKNLDWIINLTAAYTNKQLSTDVDVSNIKFKFDIISKIKESKELMKHENTYEYRVGKKLNKEEFFILRKRYLSQMLFETAKNLIKQKIHNKTNSDDDFFYDLDGEDWMEDDLSFSEEDLLDIKLIFKAEECITNLAIEIYKGITELSPEYDFKIPNGTLLRVNVRIDKTFFVNSNEKIFNAINMVNRKWVYKQNDLSEPNIDMLQNLREYDNISSTDSLMSQSDSEF